jgi:hypothetical protein
MFRAGDIPAALAAFADDIQWTEPDGLDRPHDVR